MIFQSPISAGLSSKESDVQIVALHYPSSTIGVFNNGHGLIAQVASQSEYQCAYIEITIMMAVIWKGPVALHSHDDDTTYYVCLVYLLSSGYTLLMLAFF